MNRFLTVALVGFALFSTVALAGSLLLSSGRPVPAAAVSATDPPWAVPVQAVINRPADAPTQPGEPTLFVNVNIIPMDRERVLRNHSVLVEGGTIKALAPSIEAPFGARVIDGAGEAYLLPGLADMHVHAATRAELAVMLANGVTTALDMGRAPSGMVGATRAAVARGELPGPQMFVAFAVDGSSRYGHPVVSSPEIARATARFAKANGYDFIKIYTDMAPDSFEALVAEGRALGMPVVGHNAERIGLERQIAGGQVMVAHLEEFFYGFFNTPSGDDPNAAPDAADMLRAVAFLKASGTTVTVDPITYATIARQWGRPQVAQAYLRLPEVRYLSPMDRIAWSMSRYAQREGSLDGRAQFLMRFVKELAAAGVPLIAGTDAPTIPGLVSGYALHRNLAVLEQAGLTRYQVLKTATSAPGAFILRSKPRSQPFGQVIAGARADLLLLRGNPLEDLAALQQPQGVMSGGRWFSPAELHQMIEEVATNYRNAALSH